MKQFIILLINEVLNEKILYLFILLFNNLKKCIYFLKYFFKIIKIINY